MKKQRVLLGRTLAPSAVALATKFVCARVRIPPGGLLYYRNSSGISYNIKKLRPCKRDEVIRGSTLIDAQTGHPLTAVNAWYVQRSLSMPAGPSHCQLPNALSRFRWNKDAFSLRHPLSVSLQNGTLFVLCLFHIHLSLCNFRKFVNCFPQKMFSVQTIS